MKILIFLSMLVSLVCFSDNHKHDHHDHHDDHNHQHSDEHKSKKQKSLKSHQHGVGILNIAQEENLLVFEFELPGFDVVGFEYKAKKKDDIKKVKQALSILSDHDNMIEIDNDANCKKISSKANLLEEGNHTEFRSKYVLNCSNINKASRLAIKYFQNFKNSKKLDVKIITEKKSGALELLSNNNVIKVKDYF